jgi:hypothetical protein
MSGARQHTDSKRGARSGSSRIRSSSDVHDAEHACTCKPPTPLPFYKEPAVHVCSKKESARHDSEVVKQPKRTEHCLGN